MSEDDFPSDVTLTDLAQQVGEALSREQCMLTTAESCTGGWVAQAITAIAGSSHWFERGFVTYTNTAKQEMLGVSVSTLEAEGAVSEATVSEMVKGALENSHAQVALAISGIAGPGGGSDEKPVGTVCFAWGNNQNVLITKTQRFDGNRLEVRQQAVMVALQGLLSMLDH